MKFPCRGIMSAFSTFLFSAQVVLAQGDLAPTGPPAPSMRSLSQMEPRTPLAGDTATITIAQPGSYYLTGNVTVAAGDGIVVNASQVTLDLNGFTVFSTAPTATGSGILLGSAMRDIHVLNGHVRGGVTFSGGTFSTGPGFSSGLSGAGSNKNIRVSGLSVSGVRFSGINPPSDSSVVDHCYVSIAGDIGIVGTTVSDCAAFTCGGTGIFAVNVSNSYGECVAIARGIQADTAINCEGRSSTGDGVDADAATNCRGFSLAAGSTGTGVKANCASNCAGESNSGPGVSATNATNCYGDSGSSTGITAVFATSCYGLSGSNRGISVEMATSCYGVCAGSSSFGVHVTSVATSCYGSSSMGIGLSANIANSCAGSSVAANFKYNMP